MAEEVVVRMQRICKKFNELEVLKGIDLEVRKGEVLAIIGPSGSGKSTLLRCLNHLESIDQGYIEVEGMPFAIEGDDGSAIYVSPEKSRQILGHMGMVFQYSALFDSMTVGDNVAFGLREHTKLSEVEIQQIVEDKLHLVGLDNISNMMPGELSGGMKKRVSLARAIAFEPEIIFYDEPSSGLDPIMSGKIDELIIHTQKTLKVTSVVVTHDMEFAQKVADDLSGFGRF